ncbi:hypothetical protein C8A05DRAFT_14404 [Staphylotrichum tortipilum]|uniref:Uncharacterized protein n=1 Tax=Staphylotrichum tortipilum TaxID=2831512 RepID=A0AAN6RU81_9PEZI|nr:hypothetical protein C8A05DRAFT_14404 [Staphylotrichum longicolle]
MAAANDTTLPPCRTDILISIHPRHVANIVARVKNHEFRKYLLPSDVCRLWIYETRPASAVAYVATISPGKRPGEICDPSGLRNDGFDEGRLENLAKYAYETRRLEALAVPLSLGDLKERGWLNGAPQKYCYVQQEMLQALSAAEMRLVFDSAEDVAGGETSSGGPAEAMLGTNQAGTG